MQGAIKRKRETCLSFNMLSIFFMYINYITYKHIQQQKHIRRAFRFEYLRVFPLEGYSLTL